MTPSFDELHEKGEDFTNLWAFSEFLESVGKDKVPDTDTIPIGMRKCKELGIKNVIIEADLVWQVSTTRSLKYET